MLIDPSFAPLPQREDTELALAAVRSACELVVSANGPKGWEKAPGDWVTETDLACEDAIRRCLAPSGYGFLGEESGGELSSSSPTWVVDPIDGTWNFATGSRLVAVMVARIPPGAVRADLAVVALPFLGEEYAAWAGAGAYCGRTRLRCRSGEPESICVNTAAVPRVAAPARPRVLGSAGVETSWVASGVFSASCYVDDVYLWDIAPGALIIAEAGGLVVSDAVTTSPLSQEFVAGSPTTVLRIIPGDPV